MNFQQLRILREAARQNFNLTEVANALFTSQSGVSKHIKDLEDELGVELFERKGKRLLGFTGPGREILDVVERILLDTANIKRVAQQYTEEDEGHLSLATTHTQARYVLPAIITEFKKTFPRVHLELHQCGPEEIVSLLKAGKVDIGIATEALHDEPSLVCFPFHSWQHAVVVPKHHPLLEEKNLTLEAVAQYSIITYHQGYTGRRSIDLAFEQAGLKPDIVMSALDADVIKTYVELGLGIGIIASVAWQPQRDSELVLLDSTDLFPVKTTQLALRRGHYLRSFALHLVQLCCQNLSAEQIQQQVQ
ncbi:CysB family HTH-type transcriptional regulator [Marinospirillum alkaliphilum]|uniref:LysR family transcriptional regulator, cys regulon transcriptional activator n=1 Tax=Marinospirillum alkaliphilum DSM 21637 TaxID=1122209 RepID=A0A1K1TG17_9GAMM|nr:CysB family HTH-type transcriptional regulator [Marinospirillum alkaliphilum]SFW99372.1 LysR family transcriptional regulator, cys regulon transcriptional activator [Marinospirillum alkaliphilum DSM 21637]